MYLFIPLIIIVIFLYLRSKSNFFTQDHDFLKKARYDLQIQLRNYGRNEMDISFALEAFDYFVINPEEYDGATIVRDLFDLRYTNPKVKLSSASLVHDYEYIIGANRNFIKNFKSNVRYIKWLISNGKPFLPLRFVGLTIISVFFVPYSYIKYKLQR